MHRQAKKRRRTDRLLCRVHEHERPVRRGHPAAAQMCHVADELRIAGGARPVGQSESGDEFRVDECGVAQPHDAPFLDKEGQDAFALVPLRRAVARIRFNAGRIGERRRTFGERDAEACRVGPRFRVRDEEDQLLVRGEHDHGARPEHHRCGDARQRRSRHGPDRNAAGRTVRQVRGSDQRLPMDHVLSGREPIAGWIVG